MGTSGWFPQRQPAGRELRYQASLVLVAFLHNSARMSSTATTSLAAHTCRAWNLVLFVCGVRACVRACVLFIHQKD